MFGGEGQESENHQNQSENTDADTDFGPKYVEKDIGGEYETRDKQW